MKSTSKAIEKPFDYQHSESPSYGHWLWGIAIPLVLTLIDWPFRAILTTSNILMFYLLGVFFVAFLAVYSGLID